MTTDRTAVFLRFDEPASDVLPSDAAGSLEDLRNDADSALPAVVASYTGLARELVAADATGMRAIDVDPGASLLTRSLSVQVLLRWDIDDQAAAGTTGVIISRGLRGSAVERVAYGLELRVVNAGARVGELRWFWEDLDGVRHDATGGQFQLEQARVFLMLSATRQWVSSSEVVCRYYLGDVMLNETVETQGVIGGGTTGTMTIGAGRTDDGASWADHLDGALDQLRVVDGVLAAEEIAATWRRLAVDQPLGQQLVLDCLPPGWPVDTAPDTRAGRELRLVGQALGYSSAQAENLRANVAPDRAYGEILERWEGITRQPQRTGDDIDRRRRRVVGHLRQHDGVAPPGVRTAIRELMACSDAQIQVIAYDNTIRDGFDELVAARWRRSAEADWSVAGGQLRVLAASTEAADFHTSWRTCSTGVDGPERIGGYGAQLFAQLAPTSIPDGGEAGLMLYDWVRRDALLLGLRRDGANYQVVTHKILAGAAAAATVQATTALVPHWLHLEQQQLTYAGQNPTDQVAHTARWSTTSAIAGFSEDAGLAFSFSVGWAGFYARAWNGAVLGGDLDVGFDDAAFRFPHGRATCRFYAYRDPALPGDYDLTGATAVLRRLKQAHTHAAAITQPMTAGDSASGAGLGPCGPLPT